MQINYRVKYLSVIGEQSFWYSTKSPGTLLHFSGTFSNSHRPNPPSPMLDVCIDYPEFLPTFNFVWGGGGEGELQEDFKKDGTVLRGNREMTEK